MKKVLSIVLVFILTFMSLGTTSIHAVETAMPEISFDSVETESGETVSLELSLNNNPGIAGLAISLKYDTDSLTLTDTKKGTLFSGFTAGKNFAWDESEDVTADGILATFTFAVSETAAPGEYEIEVIVRSCTNENLDDVVFEEQNIHNGKITVTEKHIPATGVSLNKETISLKTGESETLIATISPDNAINKVVTWESSDDTVATVDNEGKVTAVKKGVATITVTTEEGNFVDSCEVSVACSHANTTVHLANSSTCEVQGNEEYTTCDDCGIVVSGSDAKLPLADHKGGTATCKSKAICDVCKQPYGDYASHSFDAEIAEEYLVTAATCVDKAVYFKSCSVCGLADTNTFVYGDVDSDNHVGGTYIDGQKEASCYEEGYTGDTKCNSCYTVIKYGNVIPTSSHNPSSIWSTDEEGHWKDCGTIGCGNLIDYAKHSGGEATCVNKAVCSVCQVQYGTINAGNHKNTELRNAKDATEEEEGYTGDTYCLDCQIIVKEGTVIPKVKHIHNMEKVDANDATCTKDGNITYWYCTKCMKYYTDADGINEIEQEDTVIEKKNHTYTVLQNDDNYHWYKCSGCSETDAKEQHTGGTASCMVKAECSVCEQAYGDYAEHQMSEIVDDEYLNSVATCTESAVYFKSCSVCGLADIMTFSFGNVNPDNHVGGTYIEGQKEASCYDDGYTGDTYCEECGEKISDGQIIPAAHKTSKVDAVDATHEKDGNIEYYTCFGCDKLFLDENATTEITLADTVIAKGEHSYGDKYESDADNHWKECDCGNVIEKDTHTFGEWSVTKDATETEKGSKEKICSVCGYKVTEEIPVIKDDVTVDSDTNTDSNDGTTNDGVSDKAPQTGDTSNILLWIALFILSGTALIVTTSHRRKCIK